MGSSKTDSQETVPSEIIKDVVFDHIAHHLLANEVVTPDEYQRIKKEISDSDQMILLLDIVSRKDSKIYSKFVNILSFDYQWIAEKLKHCYKEVLKESSNKSQKEKYLSKGVTSEMIKLVQKNYRAADKWTSLAHSLGLTKHVNDIRIKVNLYGEPNSMCVWYLLQEWLGISSHNATLGSLLEVLREQEFNDVADELEEKYA